MHTRSTLAPVCRASNLPQGLAGETPESLCFAKTDVLRCKVSESRKELDMCPKWVSLVRALRLLHSLGSVG